MEDAAKAAIDALLTEAEQVAQILIAIEKHQKQEPQGSLKLFLREQFPNMTPAVLVKVADHLFTL